MRKDHLLSALIIGVCIGIAGIAIGLGFYKGRSADRYVTVKGLAEREVKADLAIWPITFGVANNDLAELQEGIEKSRQKIKDFLVGNGFCGEQISHSAPKIRDTQTEDYGSTTKPQYRYIAESTVTTRTNEVELVKKTMEKSGELVGKGVVLRTQTWENPIEFLYTSLNDIKPEMIQEATKNARSAAERFAEDSDSKVGKIRNASQGYFSINDRDRNSPDVKLVRVVTNVDYFLVD